MGNDSIEGTIGYIFPQQTVDSCGGEIRANFRDDGKVEVVYDDFEVSGRRDVSGFTSEFGDTELHTEYTSTTNARGVDSYEVKGDKWATNAKVRDEICSGAGRFCI